MTTMNEPGGRPQRLPRWAFKNWPEILTLPPLGLPEDHCAVVACPLPVKWLGLCEGHYRLAREQFGPSRERTLRDVDRKVAKAGRGARR